MLVLLMGEFSSGMDMSKVGQASQSHLDIGMFFFESRYVKL